MRGMSDADSIRLSVDALSVDFRAEQGWVRAVDQVEFRLQAGRTLALVGESGSGKSVTSLAVMGLLARDASRVEGRILLDGRNLLDGTERDWRQVRGRRIAMVFQEPMTSLNPLMTVGRQIAESVETHTELRGAAAMDRAVDMLRRVGITDATRRAQDFPHRLSGGMRQRVMIAMALACDPAVLIADEPTTALDVTLQAQILALLRALQRESGLAILFITHDLAVVAEAADDVAVMYAGRIVERATVPAFFAAPAHPYSQALLGCLPRLGEARRRLTVIPGSVPSPSELMKGCRFEPRCAVGAGDSTCRDRRPAFVAVGGDHDAACWKVLPGGGGAA